MLLEIDYHSGVPIYRQVIRQIRRQIMTGELTQDDRLQTVRDLAAKLKVNPMTISKAYSFLEAEGLVIRRRGVGLFVADVKKDRMSKIKTQLLDETVRKTAVAAIQLGVSEQDAVQLLRKHYKQLKSKSRRQK